MGKIRVGIAGCGRIATLHVLGYKENPDAEIYAVCDIDEKKARALAEETGAKKVYTSYDEMCADSNIDMIEILVPHYLHCKMTVQACKAGKHVSVQKPMALTLKECDEMIDAAKKAGVKLKVYENYVFYPPYVRAKQLIESGEIGEPLTIRIKMNAGSIKHGWKVDMSSWLWRMQEELSGGGELVFDDGNHKFSIARYFMGEPESVFAYIGKTLIEGAENININGKVVSFYEDAPSMITWKCKDNKRYGIFDITYSKDLEINTDYYACDERVEITGSKGVLWVTRCTGKMLKIPTLIMYRDRKIFTDDDLRDDWADSFIDSTKDFIDAIKNDRDPVLTGEDGRKVLKFSLAAIESSKCNRPINIDEFNG